jgi:hypothetical protein
MTTPRAVTSSDERSFRDATTNHRTSRDRLDSVSSPLDDNRDDEAFFSA